FLLNVKYKRAQARKNMEQSAFNYNVVVGQ
ncbi:Rha family transcriptional regulator, partial [Salmonella enterica subsp. enterica serovar Poona]